jgi:hypothetical protein
MVGLENSTDFDEKSITDPKRKKLKKWPEPGRLEPVPEKAKEKNCK